MKKILPILLISISTLSCAESRNNLSESCKLLLSHNEQDVVKLVDNLFLCGKDDKALKVINDNEFNLNIEDYNAIGSILFDYKYYDLSKKYFQYGVDEGDGESFYRMAYIYNHIENYKNLKKSIDLYLKAIDKGYYFAYTNLADIYISEDGFYDDEKAKYYLDKAIEYKDYRAYTGLGEISLRSGNFDQAKLYFNELKSHGYYLESYSGLMNLHSEYPNSIEYDIDTAKKYADLIEMLIEDSPKKNEILANFYSSNHKYKDINKYKKLIE